jgi:hypothetical protein
MRENLGLTILVALAAVLAAVAALAGESTWAILAGAVVVLLAAAALVIGATIATLEDREKRGHR